MLRDLMLGPGIPFAAWVSWNALKPRIRSGSLPWQFVHWPSAGMSCVVPLASTTPVGT